MNQKLSPNQLAFIGLSNEYCSAIEQAAENDRDSLIDAMARLLPRIYITAADLAASPAAAAFGADEYIDGSLDEDTYNYLSRNIEQLLGEDDVYLEAFEEDMKYSDTPIAARISENLCDIFQVLYNMLEAVKDAPTVTIATVLDLVADDFRHYWSRILCNVMRAINNLKYPQ